MTAVPLAPVGDIELFYESFGDDDDPTLLLVMGLGAQMITWPDELCRGLADRRFHVVRFDNRDIGLSTKLDHLEFDEAVALATLAAGEPIDVPYTMSDMAADAVGLLDHLGVERAHVVGQSLGGMIAQVLAIEHPDRILSLTSISSTTGAPDVGHPTPEALNALLEAGAEGREAVIEQDLRKRKAWATPGAADDDELREFFARIYDRSHHPPGNSRQLGAVLTAANREPLLAGLDVPTLVVHGDADPLVGVDGGRRTAEVVPGAELLILEGMAHDLPAPYWGPIIEAITSLAARAVQAA